MGATSLSRSGLVTFQKYSSLAVGNALAPLTVDYLVIAGGGGGGSHTGGGGGAGGYRTSVGTSGGGASAETALSISKNTNYTVTVGVGGAGATWNNIRGSNGANSVFGTITSAGGGGGGSLDVFSGAGNSGGSGGGSARTSGAAGTSSQGFRGGNATGVVGSGGGGASAQGQDTSAPTASNGGAGLSSSITGLAVTRAGGGGGAGENGYSSSGVGGSGGGGNGANASAGTAATPNTGSGGGGGGYSGSPYTGGQGGSGLVILRYPQEYDIRNGAGLTYTTSVVGTNKVTAFTDGTGNIQFTDAASSSFVLLETVTLTSAQASVEFANLATKYASTYQHLQVRMVSRATTAASEDNLIMRFNGDSGSNYHYHNLFGTGSAVNSNASGSVTFIQPASMVGSSFTASGYGVNVIDILDPFETTKNTTTKALAGFTGSLNRVFLSSGAWFNTAALNSISFANNGTFASGSRISIYGLKGS
jgi:hypothetical protein